MGIWIWSLGTWIWEASFISCYCLPSAVSKIASRGGPVWLVPNATRFPSADHTGLPWTAGGNVNRRLLSRLHRRSRYQFRHSPGSRPLRPLVARRERFATYRHKERVSRPLRPLVARRERFATYRHKERVSRPRDHLHPTYTALSPIPTPPNCIPAPVDGDLLQVMPWPNFQDMSDRDIEAIYEYLKAIPCIAGPPAPSPLHNDCE